MTIITMVGTSGELKTTYSLRDVAPVAFSYS